MAASDTQNPHTPSAGALELLAAAALEERLREEIGRATRHGTALSCVHLSIEDLGELTRTHGALLAEYAIAYAGLALRRDLRDFDRVGRPRDGELAIVLPGADGPRGEIVARRALARLRAIKLEAGGQRRALRVALGLAAWREEMTAQDLLGRARAAASRERLVFRDALRL